jgi:hypothetical protein
MRFNDWELRDDDYGSYEKRIRRLMHGPARG